MNRFRIVADSSCDLLTPDGAYFVSVPLTIRTDTEEFRDDAFLDVNEMVTVLRGTGGRSYSESPGRPRLNRSNHWFFRCHLSKNGAAANIT